MEIEASWPLQHELLNIGSRMSFSTREESLTSSYHVKIYIDMHCTVLVTINIKEWVGGVKSHLLPCAPGIKWYGMHCACTIPYCIFVVHTHICPSCTRTSVLGKSSQYLGHTQWEVTASNKSVLHAPMTVIRSTLLRFNKSRGGKRDTQSHDTLQYTA